MSNLSLTNVESLKSKDTKSAFKLLSNCFKIADLIKLEPYKTFNFVLCSASGLASSTLAFWFKLNTTSKTESAMLSKFVTPSSVIHSAIDWISDSL